MDKSYTRSEGNTPLCLFLDFLAMLISFALSAMLLSQSVLFISSSPALSFIASINGIWVLLFFYGFEMYSIVLLRFKETLVTVVLSCLYSFLTTMFLYIIVFRSTADILFLFCGEALSLLFLLFWREMRYFYYLNRTNKLKMLMIEQVKDDNSRVRRMKYATLSRFHSWYEQVDTENPEVLQRFIDEKFPEYDCICLMESVRMEARNMIMRAIVNMGKEFYVVPAMYEMNFSKIRLALFDDVMVFHINPYKMSRIQAFIKRSFDIVFALSGLTLAAVPMLLVILAIKLTSPGPIFYRQVRLTRNKKEFNILKFRSMVPNAESLSGPVFAEKDDPRITKIGRIMRKTRLDELPQFFNILQGSMSVVGPRPERPFFARQFAEKIENYDQRFTVKAGMTSLSHVYGRYSTDIADRTLYDLLYIRNFSFKLDLKVLLLTTRIVFLSEAAEGLKADSYRKIKTVKEKKPAGPRQTAK